MKGSALWYWGGGSQGLAEGEWKNVWERTQMWKPGREGRGFRIPGEEFKKRERIQVGALTYSKKNLPEDQRIKATKRRKG